jgi:hypothetical protein
MHDHSNDSHSFSAKYPEANLSVYRPKYSDNNNGSKYQYPNDLFVHSIEREQSKPQTRTKSSGKTVQTASTWNKTGSI